MKVNHLSQQAEHFCLGVDQFFHKAHIFTNVPKEKIIFDLVFYIKE